MKVWPKRSVFAEFEKAITRLDEQPVISYSNKEPDLAGMKWVVSTKVKGLEVLLFFNHKKAKLVVDLNSPMKKLTQQNLPSYYREVILNEQTKQTHTKDSRQRLQGAGFFRLLGHYASYIRQLLRK